MYRGIVGDALPDGLNRVTIPGIKVPMCLFERPFKVQKNGVFLFEISFFVLEISTFFYYAN